MFNDPRLDAMLDEIVAQYRAVRDGSYTGPYTRVGSAVVPLIRIGPLIEAAGGGYARYRRIMRMIEQRLAASVPGNQ